MNLPDRFKINLNVRMAQFLYHHFVKGQANWTPQFTTYVLFKNENYQKFDKNENV